MDSWQDIVLTIGNVVFVVALLPSVKSSDKPAIATSLMNGTVMIVFAITYFSLHLWFSTSLIALTSVLWYILAYQKYRMPDAKLTKVRPQPKTADN